MSAIYSEDFDDLKNEQTVQTHDSKDNTADKGFDANRSSPEVNNDYSLDFDQASIVLPPSESFLENNENGLRDDSVVSDFRKLQTDLPTTDYSYDFYQENHSPDSHEPLKESSKVQSAENSYNDDFVEDDNRNAADANVADYSLDFDQGSNIINFPIESSYVVHNKEAQAEPSAGPEYSFDSEQGSAVLLSIALGANEDEEDKFQANFSSAIEYNQAAVGINNDNSPLNEEKPKQNFKRFDNFNAMTPNNNCYDGGDQEEHIVFNDTVQLEADYADPSFDNEQPIDAPDTAEEPQRNESGHVRREEMAEEEEEAAYNDTVNVEADYADASFDNDQPMVATDTAEEPQKNRPEHLDKEEKLEEEVVEFGQIVEVELEPGCDIEGGRSFTHPPSQLAEENSWSGEILYFDYDDPVDPDTELMPHRRKSSDMQNPPALSPVVLWEGERSRPPFESFCSASSDPSQAYPSSARRLSAASTINNSAQLRRELSAVSLGQFADNQFESDGETTNGELNSAEAQETAKDFDIKPIEAQSWTEAEGANLSCVSVLAPPQPIVSSEPCEDYNNFSFYNEIKIFKEQEDGLEQEVDNEIKNTKSVVDYLSNESESVPVISSATEAVAVFPSIVHHEISQDQVSQIDDKVHAEDDALPKVGWEGEVIAGELDKVDEKGKEEEGDIASHFDHQTSMQGDGANESKMENKPDHDDNDLDRPSPEKSSLEEQNNAEYASHPTLEGGGKNEEPSSLFDIANSEHDMDNNNDPTSFTPPKPQSLANDKETKPKKITLDSLERYVAPQPKKVTELRNLVQNCRKGPTHRITALPRPHTANAKRAPTPSFSSTQPASKTFLTDVALHDRPQTANASPSKKHIRYYNPLRYHTKKECVILLEVCPHRKAFTKCTSFFCKEAMEKYSWLEMMRKKYQETLELINRVDDLWRQKLGQALEESVEEMKTEQRKQLRKLKISLEKPTPNDLQFLTTLQYLESTGVHKLEKEEAYQEFGVTSDHYEYVQKQIDIHKAHVASQVRTIIDHKKCHHQKLLVELREIINLPLKDLDSIKKGQLETIEFHMRRIERWILYLLDIAMQPCKDDHLQPPKEDAVTKGRIIKAGKQITDFLHNALAAFAAVCSQIHSAYTNADQEVRRMLHEAKPLHLMVEKEKPKASSRPPSPVRKASPTPKKKKEEGRPVSAPASTHLAKSLSFAQSEENNKGSIEGKSYNSDFEDPPSESRPKFSRINSKTSVNSARESVEDEAEFEAEMEIEEKESVSRHNDAQDEDSYDKGSVEKIKKDSYTYKDDEFYEKEVEEREGKKDQADQTKNKSKKAKKKKKKVLPKGEELKGSKILAKEKDNIFARKKLLFKLLDGRGEDERPHSSPARTYFPAREQPLAISTYRSDFEDADEHAHNSKGSNSGKMCFHCYQQVTGRGVHVPKLYTSGKESWAVAQHKLAKSHATFPDYLRKVEMGSDIFDLSKTFLAKLQSSAHRVSDGEPLFCTWECVKRWALSHCPLQHRYQTDILINLAAGYTVNV